MKYNSKLVLGIGVFLLLISVYVIGFHYGVFRQGSATASVIPAVNDVTLWDKIKDFFSLKFLSVTGSQGWITLLNGQVDYLSNDQDVAGNIWSMTVALNGQGQYAVAQGTIPKSEIKDTDKQMGATFDLTLKAEISPITCRYSVDNRNKAEVIYNINYEKYSSALIFGIPTELITHTLHDKCLAYSDAFYWYPSQSSIFDYYCFRRTPTATHGVLLTPQTLWSATITATSGDSTKQPETLTIGNWQNVKSGWLSGNNVYASWAGDLVGAEECPKVSLPDATFIEGKWITTDAKAFDDYDDYAKSGGSFVTCLNSYGISNVNICRDEWNNAAKNAVASKPLTFVSTEGDTYSISTGNTNIDSGVFGLQVNKFLHIPLLNFKIKAEWVGAVSTVGMPKIISVTPVDFTTGSRGYSTITVKNVGSYFGSFDYSATCDAGFSMASKAPDRIQLEPGDQATAIIYFDGSCASKKTGQCIVTVYDMNNAAKKATAPIAVTCETICIATEPAGTKKCSGNNIVESDGCRYNQKQYCPNGCSTKDNVPYCITVKPNCTGNDCLKKCLIDADCNDNNPNTKDDCIGLLDRHCVNTEMSTWDKIKDWLSNNKLITFLAALFVLAAFFIFIKFRGKHRR